MKMKIAAVVLIIRIIFYDDDDNNDSDRGLISLSRAAFSAAALLSIRALFRKWKKEFKIYQKCQITVENLKLE